MLRWRPRRRARDGNIEAQAEAMIRDFGFAAYHQARRMAHEASSGARGGRVGSGCAGDRVKDREAHQP
jgi:hypothetical protein